MTAHASLIRTLSTRNQSIVSLVRRYGPWLAGATAILLIAASCLLWWMLRDAMRDQLRHSLRSHLSSSVSSLELWFLERQRDSDRIAGNPTIARAAGELIEASQNSFEWSRDDLRLPDSLRSLDDELKNSDCLGWAILDRKQQVIASTTEALVGQRLPISEDASRRIIARRSTISRPFAIPLAITDRGPLSIPDGPLMAALSPIYSVPQNPVPQNPVPQNPVPKNPVPKNPVPKSPVPKSPVPKSPASETNDSSADPTETVASSNRGRVDFGKHVGTLALLIDPNERFSKILSTAHLGESGETFAFDAKGQLISRSRFETQLRNAGLLPEDPRITSPLRIVIRDPGVDLVAGNVTTIPRPDQPLTLMADQATRGGTGENVTGYNDYRGVSVVGAWTWLPEYEIGVATEMDAREAYLPIQLLSRLIIGLSILSLLVGLISIAMSIVMRRLSRRVAPMKAPTRLIGQYELGEALGRGGMGTVYRGTHQRLRRSVAVKVLEGDSVSSQAIQRFEREAQMTAGLRHVNTIDLYDFGSTDDGAFYYVMEHIQGITLQRLVDQYGKQPPSRVIHLLLQICGSLSEAHHQGLIHRDIKPANVMISTEPGMHDMVKVLDFGLVKDVERADKDMSLTSTEGITGTPMYMSPETVRDAGMSDQRSDIYSIGGVGYTLLTGRPMFDGDASVDICMKQLREDPIRPSDRIGTALPDDLQNVLMSCLRKDPSQRPMSIDDLAAALRQCRDAGKWDDVDALRWWSLVLDDTSPSDPSTGADIDWRTGGISRSGEGDASATAHD